MVWYSNLFQNFPQFIVIHTVKSFGIVNKAEIDVFLELSCFFDDPEDVGNLISGSSAFSKTSLNIWKFKVHVLLKPGLENVEYYFTSVWPTMTKLMEKGIEVLILWRIICQLYLKKNMFKNSLKNLAQFFYQEALKLAFFVEDTKSDFSLY